MKNNNTVERTVRSEFILRGERVGPGQIVTLNRIELEKYAAAECVYADEARNADVPVAEMPKTAPPAPVAAVPAPPSVVEPVPAQPAEEARAADKPRFSRS